MGALLRRTETVLKSIKGRAPVPRRAKENGRTADTALLCPVDLWLPAALLEQARSAQPSASDRTLQFLLPDWFTAEQFAAVRGQLAAMYRAA